MPEYGGLTFPRSCSNPNRDPFRVPDLGEDLGCGGLDAGGQGETTADAVHRIGQDGQHNAFLVPRELRHEIFGVVGGQKPFELALERREVAWALEVLLGLSQQGVELDEDLLTAVDMVHTQGGIELERFVFKDSD